MRTLYDQILSLTEETKVIERGRKFEALIREIMPWDKRPPIVISPKSEQLDGIFTYQNQQYLIESKAIKKTITPGMKEWEDYELKIRKRNRNVIGIYCSLNLVSDETEATADQLNKEGITNILLSGKIWKQLADSNIDFESYLEYLVISARQRFKASTKDLSTFRDWHFNQTHITAKITDIAQKLSAPFLTRFKHHYHEGIYVSREIDNRIESITSHLKPQALKGADKEPPKQIVIIRDNSGSGKTTLSTKLSTGLSYAFVAGITANASEIDKTLTTLFSSIGYKDYAIQELMACNKPIMFVIDSLDEVSKPNHNQKRAEIKGLFRIVKELNDFAVSNYNMRCFPICITITVREEYWRDWETSFEGRNEIVEIKKQIKRFSQAELNTALDNYSRTYSYTISNRLNEESKNIISIPINLELFSESNRFQGVIQVDDIWEGRILHNYFQKKADNIVKHYIEGFTTELFFELLGRIASKLILEKELGFSTAMAHSILTSELASHASHTAILKLLESEQIIVKETESHAKYRFRYTRFVEYLVAMDLVEKIRESANLELLDTEIDKIYESKIVSIHSILDNIKYISQTRYPDLQLEIANYYENSNSFLSKHLPHLRGLVARGEQISKEDLKVLIGNNYTKSPEITWATFFILAAKNTYQPKNVILAAFLLAWDTNTSLREHRYKLIDKLSKHNLLIVESVLSKLLLDSVYKDWEVFFGRIIEQKNTSIFRDMWDEINAQESFNILTNQDSEDWKVAIHLLQEIIGGRNQQDRQLPVHSLQNVFTSEIDPPVEISDNAVPDHLNTLISAFLTSLHKNQVFPNYLGNDVHKLSNSDKLVLRQQLEMFRPEVNGCVESALLNCLYTNYSVYRELIRSVAIYKIPLEVNTRSRDGKTLLQHANECRDASIFILLEFLFECGYKKNISDDNYLQRVEFNKSLSPESHDRLLLTKMCYTLGDPVKIKYLSQLDRLLFTLYSLKYDRVMGFRFPNLVSVVNNALEHYGQHTALVLEAIEIYNRTDILSKTSIKKKIMAYNANRIVQDTEHYDIIRQLLPGLV